LNKKSWEKILILLEEFSDNPFPGTGNPEPLRHKFPGLWSRRINKVNRLIYEVVDNNVFILSFRGNYAK